MIPRYPIFYLLKGDYRAGQGLVGVVNMQLFTILNPTYNMVVSQNKGTPI